MKDPQVNVYWTCGVSSPNTSEVTFKPKLDRRTYQKSSTPETKEYMAEDSGPNKIPDTGMSQELQAADDNPEAQENVDHVETEPENTEEQRSPSQRFLKRPPKSVSHYVAETQEDSETVQWPQPEEVEGMGYRDNLLDQPRSSMLSPKYIVERVRNLKASHAAT